MHLQPLYRACARYGGAVAEALFERGLCLPSSSSLTAEEQDEVIDVVRGVARGRRASALTPSFASGANAAP
jgi:pyridoxal phosphate-dependent aminotransferase EpsN